jgi:hypothetical protein
MSVLEATGQPPRFGRSTVQLPELATAAVAG